MGELSKLKGIGPKSEKCLNEIGIYSREDLEKAGAVKAFVRLSRETSTKPSLNFLYAMVGALEDKHWAEIARHERERLLSELEGFHELESMLQADDKSHKQSKKKI